MLEIIVILTNINGRCDTTDLFMSNNRLRAKMRRTICMALTKKVVTLSVIKERTRYYTDKEDSEETVTLNFSEAKINK